MTVRTLTHNIMKTIRLATVSPCYNEEDVLRHSVERLTALFERMIEEGLISEDSMMVFVNDGSRDRTWQIIRELHDENRFVRGINLAHNVGHQNAIMAGMMTAREWADAVITIDADLQDDIECIPKMLCHFEMGRSADETADGAGLLQAAGADGRGERV